MGNYKKGNIMDDKITIIIPNRGGKDLDKVIKNLNEVYYDIEKEILVIQQEDDMPFMRGQLYNIGVKYADSDYIALSDNDIYHLRKLPLFDIYENNKKPIVCFKWISQLDYNNGNPKILFTELRGGTGAFNFMKKSDFISVNGFSNLYVGWGCEDIDFMKRFGNHYIRVPQNLGHIQHPRRVNKDEKNSNLNKVYLEQFNKRNFMEDGFYQTTYNLISKEDCNGFTLIKVNNVSVCENFVYKSLLDKHFM